MELLFYRMHSLGSPCTLQLAKHYGIKTISVVRGDHHVQELKDLG